MTWNYRVCKETYSVGTPDEEVTYSIREAYYNNDKVDGVTTREVGAIGESVEELREVLINMLAALDKEVLDVDALWPEQAGLV